MENVENLKETLSILKRELDFHGLSFEKDSWLESRAVLEEIFHVLVAVLHEGKTPACGAIFTEHPEKLGKVRSLAMKDDPEQLGLARKLANGIGSFLLYEKDRFSGLVFFSKPMGDELELVRLLSSVGGLIVQRSRSGLSKFFLPNQITLHENRVWSSKPHVSEAARRVIQCVPKVDRSVLNRILEFSFHLLSPASRTGATLVWCLTDPLPKDLAPFSAGQDLRTLELSLLDERDAEAVCHFFSQIDGATFLDPRGRLILSGVQLNYSKKSRDLIPETKGTRHTSARRFSYDHPETLVVVISEDGPVTVFSDGASIADLRVNTALQEAKLLKNAVPEQKEDISNRSFEETCKVCEKTAMLEEVKVRGCIERKEVQCPTCQTKLHSSDCFTLECYPVKSLAND